jgi:hypothetical protein
MSNEPTSQSHVTDLRDDIAPPLEGEFEPLVPPGQYVVSYIRADSYEMQINGISTPKISLTFRIVKGPYAETQLLRHYNLRTDGKMGRRSAYLREWLIANGGEDPRRLQKDRMSVQAFKGKEFIAKVTTTKSRGGYEYSKIAEICSLDKASNEVNAFDLLPST